MILDISCYLHFPVGHRVEFLKIIKFYMMTRLGGSRHITMPNFLETGLSKGEILRFFDLPNGRRRHLLFLKLPNFFG